jgi:hypothetical protein
MIFTLLNLGLTNFSFNLGASSNIYEPDYFPVDVCYIYNHKPSTIKVTGLCAYVCVCVCAHMRTLTYMPVKYSTRFCTLLILLIVLKSTNKCT